MMFALLIYCTLQGGVYEKGKFISNLAYYSKRSPKSKMLHHYDHEIYFPLCKGTYLAAGFSLHCTTGYPGNDVALHQNKEDQEWKGSHNR